MKNLRKVLTACLAGAVVLSLAGCGDSKDLKLGTGGTGGNYYAFGNVLTSVAEENSDYTFNLKTTAGSAANLRLLNQEFLDFAIVQSDTLQRAVNGEDEFEDKALTGFSAVAGLYTEACQIVVSDDSGIETIDDLAGKRVSIGEEESGVTKNAEMILQMNGLSTDMLEVSRLSFSDSAAAMKDGDLDAFFCTAGAPTTAVTELAGEMSIHILSLDQDTISHMIDYYDGYSECTIPAGTYSGQEEDVTTIGVKAILVARDKVSSDAVSEITALLFDHAADFQYATNIDISLDMEEAVEGIPIGFHSGAASYYESQGISVTEGTAGETSYGVSGSQDN